MKTYLVSNSTHTLHSVGATGDEPRDLPHAQHVVLHLDDAAAERHRNACLVLSPHAGPAANSPGRADAGPTPATAPKKRVRAPRAKKPHAPKAQAKA